MSDRFQELKEKKQKSFFTADRQSKDTDIWRAAAAAAANDDDDDDDDNNNKAEHTDSVFL
jgi:hypothetical protein